MLDQMNGAILRWVSKYFTHQVVLEIHTFWKSISWCVSKSILVGF